MPSLRIIALLVGAFIAISADAAQVQHLSTQTATASGAGASGTPSMASFNIPSGKNRVLFIWATFERDHCSPADVSGGLATNSNTAGTGLGDNWPEPRIGTPPATTTNSQITAQVIGPAGTVSKKNALVIGGTPSGDLRFITISTSPTGSPAGTAFFSVSSFHIALFENDIRALLGNAASGNVSISLPDVTTPSNAGDDAFIVASVYQNVDQSVNGFVRNATATAQLTTGTPGNFTLAPAAYDAGQAADESDDGKLVLGTNASTEGFLALSGHTSLASVSITNAGGQYDTPNGNVHNEPNGLTASAFFRNGGATPGSLYSLQAAAAAATLVYGGTSASFLIESDNADVSDAPIAYGTASHTISGIRLGASVDADAALLNNSSATGDDVSDTDDEDGVTIPATLALGQMLSIPVSIQNASGFVSAWVDWNQDGDFNDVGEQLVNDAAVAVGTTNLNFTVPVSATTGTTFARFRVCSATGQANIPASAALSGEVEDYAVTIGSPSSNADLADFSTTAGGIVFSAATTSYSVNVPNSTTTTTVTATRADANATLQVRINGGSFASLTSGSASDPLSLDVGPNTIDVKVTAQDGTTTKTYTITVNRAGAPEIAVTESGTGNVGDGGSFAFGVSNAAVQKTFTVSNSGTGDLTLSNLTVPAGFTITSSFGTPTVTPGNSTTFQITMPAVEGSWSGTLSFDNNDADENPNNFTISGQVDLTPPDTTIISNPPNPSTSSSASFTFNGSDVGGSGVASFEAKLDGGSFAAATSPLTFTGLTEGSHTVLLRSIDNAGNADTTPASYTWTVDTLPPTTPVVLVPANGSTTTDTTPEVSGTAEPGVWVYISFDNVLEMITLADGSGHFAMSPFIPRTLGAHTVKAYARDDAGLSSGDSNVNTFTIVALMPEIAVSGQGTNIADGNTAIATADDTDFGSIPVQGISVTHTFTIQNSGDANLTLGTVGLTGAGASHFSVTLPVTTTVASSASTTFTITYDPSAAGTHTATVSFTNNDSDESPFNFDVQGTGTGPRTFDLAGNPVTNTPFETGETYIYSLGPPPPLPVAGPNGNDVVTNAVATDATGETDGTQFDALQRSGYIAENGTLAFLAYLKIGVGGVDATNFMGYWKHDGSTLTRLARQGFDAPETGATAAKFNILPLIPGINDEGQVTLFASLLQSAQSTPATTADNDTGLWSELGGTGFQILIREDDAIPGLSGEKVDTLGYGCFATAKTGAGTGEAAFVVGMKGSSTDTALLRASVTGPTVTAVGVIARENSPAPGTSENFNFIHGGYTGAVRMDATGNVVFAGWLKPSNKLGVWYQDMATKTVSKTALTGETASGTGGATFGSIDLPNMGGNGTYAFRAVLNMNGDNADNSKNDGIWKGTATTAPIPILRRGDNNTNRPGLFSASFTGSYADIKAGNIYNGWLTNANHGAWLGWVDLGGNGISAFASDGNFTAATDALGIYTDTSGTMTLLTASGQPAPGIAGANFFLMDHPVCGGVEQVAFIGIVTGGGVSSGVNDKGIWRTSSNGSSLNLALRTGDTMSVSVNGTPTTKTIADLDIPGSGYAEHIWETPVMDGTGRLLVFVTFTDGTTSQVIVP